MKIKCPKCDHIFYSEESNVLGYCCFGCGRLYKTEKEAKDCTCHGTKEVGRILNSDFVDPYFTLKTSP